MAATISVLGLILSSYPYLRSAMKRYPLEIRPGFSGPNWKFPNPRSLNFYMQYSQNPKTLIRQSHFKHFPLKCFIKKSPQNILFECLIKPTNPNPNISTNVSSKCVIKMSHQNFSSKCLI